MSEHLPIIIPVLLGAAALAGFLVWRARRNRSRLISFVALVSEPVRFDPAVLAGKACRAWDADLGDGDGEGEDGFVVVDEPFSMVMNQGRMCMINSFAAPYTEDPEQVAEGIGDLRIRGLFARHRGWFSVDAMNIDGRTSDEEVADWYRYLARLFVELLDDNCLLIFLPDHDAAFPINEETEAALRSDDPLAALAETLTAPVIEIAPDDPLMLRAVARAREEWPAFVAAFEASAGEHFAIKAPITHGETTEFIWVTVKAIDGEQLLGELGNDPADLGPLRFGSEVTVPLADLNDWTYVDADEQLRGGFTMEALAEAARRR